MEQENLHSLREQVARQAQLRSRERSLKSQLPALKAREEETVRPAPVHQEVPEVREE